MKIYEEKKNSEKRNNENYKQYKNKYIIIATGDIIDTNYFT